MWVNIMCAYNIMISTRNAVWKLYNLLSLETFHKGKYWKKGVAGTRIFRWMRRDTLKIRTKVKCIRHGLKVPSIEALVLENLLE